MLSFYFRHTVEKQRCLTEMVLKTVAALANFVAFDSFCIMHESTHCFRRHHRTTAAQRIGSIVDFRGVNVRLHYAVALIVVHGTDGTVNRQFRKVGTSQTVHLRVGIGKQSTLQDWIVGKINTRNYVARLESNLLGFCEEVVGVAIEYHFADRPHGNFFFRNQLSGIEQVKVKLKFVFFLNNLHAQFKLGIIALFDRIPQIAAAKIRIFAGEFLCFIPHQRMHAQNRLPVELDKARFAFGVDKAESMHAKALHHAEASRYSAIAQYPHNHVHRFWHQ